MIDEKRNRLSPDCPFKLGLSQSKSEGFFLSVCTGVGEAGEGGIICYSLCYHRFAFLFYLILHKLTYT